MNNLCRLATPPIAYVAACPSRPLPRVTNELQRNGLRYQRKVTQALLSLAIRHKAKFFPEPWFEFSDANGRGQIAPDGVLIFGDQVIVIEVKTTYVPVALAKLDGLYVPLVGRTTLARIYGLVICKHITPEAPDLIDRLTDTFRHQSTPVLQWLGHGPILW